MNGMTDLIKIGKESTRGEEAASYAMRVPFMGDGLVPTTTPHLGEVMSSSTFPYVTDQVHLGTTSALVLTPDFNVATIRSLILMATKRTAEVMASLTIGHSRVGVSDAAYVGCLCSQLNYEYSRSGSPDVSAILQGSMNFETMGPIEPGGAISGGTAGNGRRFKLPSLVATIDGVAATKILSFRRSFTNVTDAGAPNDDNIRMYMEEGVMNEEFVLRAYFDAADWYELAAAGTEHAVSFVHGTGTANETFTEAIAKAKISSHNLGREGGTVIEEITVKPYYGSAAPTVITFGSSIGADSLSL